MVAPTRIPLATYRLQFNSGFTFKDARTVVDYLHDLGISDCYASSYLKAVPGSLHGYDVADPTQLNPEIGSDADHAAWIDTMQARGMGHVMDLVPNHMGIAKSANPWWLDVLENGASSRFARFFDIEWHPVKDELADKVLLPILGAQYGEALEHQELKLTYRDGAFFACYFEDTLPIAPDTYAMVFEADLEAWQAEHPGADADELLSILTASRNLPRRSDRAADAIAARAREKEIVKRRLAELAERSVAVRALIDRSIDRLNGTPGQPRSFDAIDRLFNAQSYRLAHWRVASEEINYRRFFDVNQLAALRMEDPAVFDEVHRFVFDLVERGAVTGLRIDHVDGLFDPGDYLRRLQERTSLRGGREHGIADETVPGPLFYVVVEKILGSGEQLAADWPVNGTTGYEFATTVNNLFVDGRNERPLSEIYRRFTRERIAFDDLAYRSKKQVLHETMSGDINSLGHQLNRFSERNRHFRDFTLYSLISTLKEVIACFPVYRTYVTATDPISDHDRRYITEAIQCARRKAPAVPRVVFEFIQKLLLKQTAAATPDEGDEQARFTGKFQQLTSPVAAKGIEDSALYVFNRLLSLNEVGSDPTQFGLDPPAVHAWMAERQARWPHALSATSTHDTKRGEDVRARLNVLSEMPRPWKEAVSRWRALNRRFKNDPKTLAVPDPNEEYFIYQTLVGAWPSESDEETRSRFVERIATYMTKALREAKVHTSWLNPDEEYEKAIGDFVRAILDPARAKPFLQAFQPFQARVAQLGIYNSLSQLVIKITAPGVPDFYQGTEFWDLNLVDPDNRRQVDYGTRRQILSGLHPCSGREASPEALADLLERRTDGHVKMYTMHRALSARAALRDAFAGEYTALTTSGARRECLFAFARGGRAITCVPRLVATLTPDGAPPVGTSVWTDTRVDLPESLRGRRYRNVFTGATIDGGEALAAAVLFDRFPVALLAPAGDPSDRDDRR